MRVAARYLRFAGAVEVAGEKRALSAER